MPESERLAATVSTKGQIVLPKAVRAPRRWGAGTRLVVENTPDGVLLKSAPVFAETRPEERCSEVSPAAAAPGPWPRWRRGFWRKRSGAMRAVGANVVVRYLTGDDPGQAARAKAAIDAGNVFVSTTVLLESAWVLRSVYGLAGEEAAAALRAFSGLPGVSVESPDLIAEALGRAEAGMDVADALHLGAAARCEALLTFDRRFIELAGDAPVRVTEP